MAGAWLPPLKGMRHRNGLQAVDPPIKRIVLYL